MSYATNKGPLLLDITFAVSIIQKLFFNSLLSVGGDTAVLTLGGMVTLADGACRAESSTPEPDLLVQIPVALDHTD